MGRAYLKALLVLPLAAAVLAGCTRGPDPVELDDSTVSVHAVLEVGADSVVAVISRPSDRRGQFAGVSGAEVGLTTDGEAVRLVETPGDTCLIAFLGRPRMGSGAGCYKATLPSPVRAGSLYGLQIQLAEGTVISGETRTPDAVEITRPEPGRRVLVDCDDPDRCEGTPLSSPPFFVPVGSIPVDWQADASVSSAEVIFRPTTVHFQDALYPGDACDVGFIGTRGGRTARITFDLRIARILCGGGSFPELAPARFDSIRGELSVFGRNEAYSRYLESLEGEGVRGAVSSHGIDGAFGVFGAVSRATRTIVLVRDPPAEIVP